MSGVELTTALGTVDVENLVLRLPAHGNWVATMDIGAPAGPAEMTPATLKIARSTGSVDTFTGTVRRRNLTPGTQNLSVTIVGGAARLLAPPIPARHHTGGSTTVPAGLVLAGIAQAAGERLAAGAEAAIDAYPLQRYTRVAGEAWAALDVLASDLGVEWRVLADGALWMGTETWPTVDARAYYYRGDPRDGAVLYIPDGAPYRPGTTIDGARVVECCYRIKPGEPIMEARVAVPGDPVHVPPLVPYARCYVASVKSQNTDLTLNLAAVDPILGNDLRNVPFKLSIPGSKTTVPPGSIVRVAFESGLPTGIYAGDVDMDPLATKLFALEGGAVVLGTLAVGGAVGAVLTFTPTGGAPVGPAPSVILSGVIGSDGQHKYLKGVPGP